MIISFASSKGGVGKSTICAAIGARLAGRGEEALILDLDQYLRIGRAYPHNAGEGLTLILDALPVQRSDPEGMHIVLLELDEADDRRLLAEARRRGRNKGTSKASWRRLPTQH